MIEVQTSKGAASDCKMEGSNRIAVNYIQNDFQIEQFDETAWNGASSTPVSKYWSDTDAPVGRQFWAMLLWSDTALYVRFDASQDEPLIVSDKPDLTHKVKGLWERDVCEIFIAPDKNNPNKYFEFEVAPTGEWIDVAVEVSAGGRKTDWEYESGMTTAARIEQGKVVMSIMIPWTAFGKTPEVGDIWLGNVFRCVGSAPTRGYLAWRPTRTEKPGFHVPSKFGEFLFVK
jgi:hypothetical protein